MALTLTKSPDVLNLTGNEIAYRIHSDNAFSNPGGYAESLIAPVNVSRVFGTTIKQVTINFTWGSNSLTIKNTTQTLAGDYNVYDPVFYDRTMSRVVIVLMRDYEFSSDFNAIVESYVAGGVTKYRIRIRAKNIGIQYNLMCDIDDGYSYVGVGNDKELQDNYRTAWQVQIYNATELVWDDIGEIQMESVDDNGDVDIDVSEFLQRDVSGHFQWPQLSANNMTAINIIDRFRIKYMEYYGATAVFYNVSYSSARLCLQGRISQLRMASIIQSALTFYTHLVNSQKFLNFAPKNKLISFTQREILYYFCPVPVRLLRLFVKAYFTDGTNSSDTLVKTIALNDDTNYQNAIIEIFSGYAVLGIGSINVNKIVSYYQVWVADVNSLRLSEIRRFTLDKNFNEFERYFIYRNKLGLYETLRTTGMSYARLETEKGFIRVPLSGDYDINERSIKQATVDKEVTITQNSGHIEDISIINYISEFLESADAYFCDNKYAYPITIVPGKYELYQDKSGIYYFEFDYQFALQADSTEEFLVATNKGSFNDSFNNSFF
jgi:hypothetical protein